MGTGYHFWANPPITFNAVIGKSLPAQRLFPGQLQPQLQQAHAGGVPDMSGGPKLPENYVQPVAQGRRRKDYSKMGWLTSTTLVNTWPSGLRRICPGWTFVNSTCKNGRNCHKQHAYYCQLTPQEK